MAFYAPRNLNDPVRWRASTLKNIDLCGCFCCCILAGDVGATANGLELEDSSADLPTDDNAEEHNRSTEELVRTGVREARPAILSAALSTSDREMQ